MIKKKPRFFYGWVIVAVVLVAQIFCFGTMYSFSVFLIELVGQFGWSRGVTSSVYTLAGLVQGLTAIPLGILIDRIGPRKVLPAGAILAAIGLAACSQMNALWQFFLLYGVLAGGFGLGCIGLGPVGIIINRWFIKKRGTALGIAVAGIGIGTLAIVPLVQSVIQGPGWRVAYLMLAAMVLIIVVPLTAIFLRRRPEDMGLLPDGLEVASKVESPSTERTKDKFIVDEKWASTEWTVGLAIRNYRFWFLAGANAIGVVGLVLILIHQVAYFVDVGYSKMLAALIFGLVGIIGAAFKVIWGFVSDRLGREWSYTIGTIIISLGIFMMMSVKNTSQPWMLYAFAVVWGIGYGVFTPLFPAAAGDMFMGKNFGAIYGVMGMVVGLPGAFGPWLGGYIFDVTGSYTAALATAIAAHAISIVFIWVAGPGRIRLVGGKTLTTR